MRDRRPDDRWLAWLDAAGLTVSVPFDMADFCAQLARHRGRPIDLVAVGLGGQISGLWVPMPETDVVFYEQAATPLHRRHIQLHEIGHLLCDQPHPDRAQALQELMPDLDLTRMERLMARAGYGDAVERDVERFARTVGRLALRPGTCTVDATTEQVEALARAEHAFGASR